MNSNLIEQKAITYLNTILLECPHIKSEINQNDKGISWDGFLYLFSHDTHKKENLRCKCEIQVKGKEHISSSLSYSIEVADLINYKNNGGVLYFVIDVTNKKVYYIDLLPVRIGHAFNIKPESIKQKTLNFKLEEFSSNPIAVENLIYKFCEHSDKQRLSKGKVIRLLENKIILNGTSDLRGDITFIEKNNSVYLSEKETYLYKTNNDGTILPIDLIKIDKLNKSDIVDIKVNDEFLFKLKVESVLTTQNEEPYLLINDNIYIYYNENSGCPLKFTLSGCISNLANSFALMEKIQNGSKIQLGDWASFRMMASESSQKEFTGLYGEFLSLLSVFQYFKIENKLNYSDLTDSDISILLWMSSHILGTEKLKKDAIKAVNLIVNPFSVFELIMLAIDYEDNNKVLLNPFDESLGFSNGENDLEIYPLFMAIDIEALESAFNINYDNMISSIKSIKFNKKSINMVISFILQALSFYDNSNNQEFLKVITELAHELYIFDTSLVNCINYLQCVKRIETISYNQYNELMDLYNSYNGSDKKMMECACALISDNNYKYCSAYRQLSKDEKERFDLFPIKRLERYLNNRQI